MFSCVSECTSDVYELGHLSFLLDGTEFQVTFADGGRKPLLLRTRRFDLWH
jgi:hypothetical protein